MTTRLLLARVAATAQGGTVAAVELPRCGPGRRGMLEDLTGLVTCTDCCFVKGAEGRFAAMHHAVNHCLTAA